MTSKEKRIDLTEFSPIQRLTLKLWYAGAKIPEICGRTGQHSAVIYKTIHRYEEMLQ